MSHYPEVSLPYVHCSTIHLFGSTSPARTSKGATTMVTHPIQRRAIRTSRTMPQILSRTPKITTHALSRQATRRRLRSTNRIIPWATILLTCLTANHPHQITPTHTLRLLTLFTPSLHHRRPFSSNRSSTLLSPLTNPSVLPTSTSLTHL
jgi:hypothetical protein